VAIDASTGTEIWRTKLKGSSVVTVCVTANRLYGGGGGELFCLEPASGSIVWRNRLKGLGTGIVAFASSRDEVIAAARAAEEAAAAAAGAAVIP
jgi:hypothetical protein